MHAANQQIADFYKKRFPAQDSQIATEFGKLAAANGVTINAGQVYVNVKTRNRPARIRWRWKRNSRAITFPWRSLSMRWNAMTCFFIISSITLAGEQKGPIKLQMKLETYLKAGA